MDAQGSCVLFSPCTCLLDNSNNSKSWNWQNEDIQCFPKHGEHITAMLLLLAVVGAVVGAVLADAVAVAVAAAVLHSVAVVQVGPGK